MLTFTSHFIAKHESMTTYLNVFIIWRLAFVHLTKKCLRSVRMTHHSGPRDGGVGVAGGDAPQLHLAALLHHVVAVRRVGPH